MHQNPTPTVLMHYVFDEIAGTSLSSLRFRRPSSSWNLECLVIGRVQIQNLEIEDPGLGAVKNRDMAHQIDPAYRPPRVESDCDWSPRPGVCTDQPNARHRC